MSKFNDHLFALNAQDRLTDLLAPYRQHSRDGLTSLEIQQLIDRRNRRKLRPVKLNPYRY